MTNDDLKKIIDSVNDGSASDRIFMRPLLNNVKIARVWTKYPDGKACNEGSYPFYFVFSDLGKCIAAISDLGDSDLHVYTLNAYRRQGLMCRALKDVVLPHLHSIGRATQRTQFNKPASRRLLEKLGFTILDESTAEISLDTFAGVTFPESTSIPIPADRRYAIAVRLWQTSALVKMVVEEMRSYEKDSDLSFYLTEISRELDSYGGDLA